MVHRVLRALEEGVVEEVIVPREASRWRIAPGVLVLLEPARVAVEGARPTRPRLPATETCRAITNEGRPCRLPPVAHGLCFLHGGDGRAAASGEPAGEPT